MGHDLLCCAHCDDRIGVYEPIFVEYDDGSIEKTSKPALAGRAHAHIWHAACFTAPGARPAGSDE